MNSASRAAALILAIDAAVAVRVALVWDRLPAVMASHYGASGAPNGWMSRAQFFAFMAAVAGGTTLLFAASGFLLRRIPTSLINLPNREHWLAPERRAATLDRLSGWMGWFGVGLTAFLAVVTELVVRANLAQSGLSSGPFLVALAGFGLFTVWSLVTLFRQFRPPR